MGIAMSKRKPKATRRARPPEDGRVREAQDDPHRLAKVYLRAREVQSSAGWSLKFWRDDWWVWDGQRYRVQPDEDLRSEITREIKREFDRWAAAVAKKSSEDDSRVAKVTTSLVSNVLQALKGLVLISADVEQPAWVGRSRNRRPVLALSNGLVDLDRLLAGERDVLRVHSPDWFSGVCLGYAYDADATCPDWLRFLDEALEQDGERIDLVQEEFGYCLTPDTSLQKFLVAAGEGGNGKKAFTEVLTGLLGEQNVSHVPLELFGERFQLTMTLGMLANIATEIGDIDRAAEGILKAYTSGDRMYFDRKNRPGVSARPTARLIFTTNNLPRFRDRSNGVLRRMILLPFRVVIPVEQQDRLLAQKLQAELPGIFNWSIEGLRRLRANGRFTEPRVCREALQEYWTDNNPARAFLQDEVGPDSRGAIECARLYSEYRSWCDQGGYRPLNEREFGKEVRRVYPAVKRAKPAGGRHVERPWTYFGIQFASVVTPRPVAVAIRKSP